LRTEFLLLCTLLGLESWALRALLREVLALRRLIGRPSSADVNIGPALGSPAPVRRARELFTEQFVALGASEKTSTLMYFVNASSILAARGTGFISSLHAMLHKVEGRVYLVCRGPEATCEELARRHGLSNAPDLRVRVFSDPTGDIARTFSVTVFPSAILIDETGRIAKTGRMVFDDSETLAQMADAETSGERTLHEFEPGSAI
jgi:hypothetical protein